MRTATFCRMPPLDRRTLKKRHVRPRVGYELTVLAPPVRSACSNVRRVNRASPDGTRTRSRSSAPRIWPRRIPIAEWIAAEAAGPGHDRPAAVPSTSDRSSVPAVSLPHAVWPPGATPRTKPPGGHARPSRRGCRSGQLADSFAAHCFAARARSATARKQRSAAPGTVALPTGATVGQRYLVCVGNSDLLAADASTPRPGIRCGRVRVGHAKQHIRR
jgi:hypothetical protein